MRPEPWYQGTINREEAEARLKMSSKIKGVFLVREKNAAEGDYVLSIRTAKDTILHITIKVPAKPQELILVQKVPSTYTAQDGTCIGNRLVHCLPLIMGDSLL